MKTVKIMRGIPGSGKSTHARFIRDTAHTNGLRGYIVSADQYFMVDGEYKFDAAKIGEAHKWCLNMFMDVLKDGMTPVIVDNTNINIEDVAPYVAVAEALGYDVQIIQVNADPELAASRNLHSVPRKVVMDMHHRLNRIVLPRRWKITHV